MNAGVTFGGEAGSPPDLELSFRHFG